MSNLIVEINNFVTKENNIVPITLKNITLDSIQKIVACIDGGTGLQHQDEKLENAPYKINVFGGFAGIVLNLYKACCDAYGKEKGRIIFEQFFTDKLASSYLHSCNHYHNDDYTAVHFHDKKAQGELCHIGCGHLNKNLSERDEEERNRYITNILGQNLTNGDFIDLDGLSVNERLIDVLHRDHTEMAIVINVTPFDEQATTYTIKTNRLFDDANEKQLFFYDKTLDDELIKMITNDFNSRKQNNYPNQQDLKQETIETYNDIHKKVTLNKLRGATQLIKDDKVYTVMLGQDKKPLIEPYSKLKDLLDEK